MTFGVTRGEFILVAFIFGLIYVAGLLPKIAARLSGGTEPSTRTSEGRRDGDGDGDGD